MERQVNDNEKDNYNNTTYKNISDTEKTEKATHLISNKIKVKGDDLTKLNILSYGIGHFQNDLCASCWFFFLSYYLKDIVKIGEYNAGYVMLAGQIADALATPTVGILSDKTNTRIGKRTPWYIGGTILVLLTFTMIFIKVIPDNTSEYITLFYYCLCASLFNIGWAAVQVSHMALLPSISLSKKNKDMMNRIRTGFTFLAQTMALLISFFFFWLVNDKIQQYEVLAVSCVSLGFITSVIFLVLCRENVLTKNIPFYLEKMRKSLEDIRGHYIEDKPEQGDFKHFNQGKKSNKNNNSQEREQEDNLDEYIGNGNGNKNDLYDYNYDHNCKFNQIFQSTNEDENVLRKPTNKSYIDPIQNVSSSYSDKKVETISWTYWLTKPDFYMYMLVYMFVRLSINITQSVIPFYMEYMLKFHKTQDGGTPIEISIVLLISTFGSILNSTVLQSAIERKIKNPRNNRLVMISISALFVLLGCVPMFFLSEELNYPIYGLAFIFGIGFSQGLSTVSNLINDVVGSKGAQGAFVYGAYSFADKLSCGLVLAFFIPIADNVTVLKYSMPIFPPASLICAFVIVLLRNKCKEERKEVGFTSLNEEKSKNIKSFIDDSRFTFITDGPSKF
jgi:Na+/melibiose symporter-like transporter